MVAGQVTDHADDPRTKPGPAPRWGLALVAAACFGGGLALATGACFGGEFVRGMPCKNDSNCGPRLRCDDKGLCGGVGDGAICGNGLIDEAEECDDSLAIADGSCTPECRWATCGDGYVGPEEECDDGNDVETDACTSVCRLPVCGDGFIQASELCDDGNTVGTDACTSQCRPPSCDDGLRNGDEADIDCGGGCATKCAIGRACLDDADCVGGVCRDRTCIEVIHEVSPGYEFTCVRLNTGVRCWGTGIAGQLGYADTAKLVVVEDIASAGVIDLGGTAVQLTAGDFFACAVLDDKTVRCWGDNQHGNLGQGNNDNIGDDEAPASVPVIDIGGPVEQLVSAGLHSCALLFGGTVRCWGHNGYGQLGYGNTQYIGDDERPASAGDVDIGGVVTRLAAGGAHTCALLDTGSVRCWGSNFNGELGYGNHEPIGDDESPASAGDVDVGGKVVQLSVVGGHNCALLDTGAVRCWGFGPDGQLGHGVPEIIGDDELPSSVGDVDVGGKVTSLQLGRYHSCALLAGGGVRCWGVGLDGLLGYGNQNNIGDDETPASAGDVDLGGPAIQLAADVDHTCALLDDRRVRCWGNGGAGRLGHPEFEDIGDDETPASAGDVRCLLP